MIMSIVRQQIKVSELGIIGVFFMYWKLRLFPGGRIDRLIASMASENEEVSMAATMVLVKLGTRYIPQLKEALADERLTQRIVCLLGDIGDPAAIPLLKQYAGSTDEQLAIAARESIAVIEENCGKQQN